MDDIIKPVNKEVPASIDDMLVKFKFDALLHRGEPITDDQIDAIRDKEGL